VALREAMVGTLNSHARAKRWCSRSKPWWTEELAELLKQLGRARRRPAGIGRTRDARRNLRRAIRKAKKECWNKFLQEANVGIYGSINVKIVLQYYAGTRSLYIQEGRQDKGRKTVPPSRCSGTQSCPDASSSLDASSSPDASSSLDASSSPDASLF